LAGDVSKIYKLGKENNNFYNSFSAVLLAKFGYLTAVILFSLIGLFNSQFDGRLFPILFFMFIFIAVCLSYLLFFNAKINTLFTQVVIKIIRRIGFKDKHIAKISNIITLCRTEFQFENIISNFILSFTVCMMGFIKTFLIIKDIGYFVSLADLFWVSGVSAIVSVLPLSIGGLGLTQLTMVNLLSLFNIPLESSLAITLISVASGLSFVLLGGMLELVDIITRKS
jgi:uncharacterized protein (TIRG00374 family)